MKFAKKYTEYWKKNVKKPIDGLKIAGEKEVLTFLPLLNIEVNNKVLDLGCSYGRLHPILSLFSKNIYGVDPDKFAVETASKEDYMDVKVGDAENINFDNSYFDKIFCWAVYDVVDHFKGLLEANRVLKKDGKILITGKLDNYYLDDKKAFSAEKNAFLKSFPNHFVDMELLFKNIEMLGFSIKKLLIFLKRGDMGKLEFLEFDPQFTSKIMGYEYLMILKKTGDFQRGDYIRLDQPHSKTAINQANKAGYTSVRDYFKFIGID